MHTVLAIFPSNNQSTLQRFHQLFPELQRMTSILPADPNHMTFTPVLGPFIHPIDTLLSQLA